jgi:hypothetical protein
MSPLLYILIACFAVSVLYSLVILKEIAERKVALHRKVLAFLVDVVHIFIIFLPIVLILSIMYDVIANRVFDMRKLLFLNLIFIGMVVGILFFGMCSLTVLYNKLLDLPSCSPFVYRWGQRTNEETRVSLYHHFTTDNPGCEKNTRAWMKNHINSALVLLSLNALFFLHAVMRKHGR